MKNCKYIIMQNNIKTVITHSIIPPEFKYYTNELVEHSYWNNKQNGFSDKSYTYKISNTAKGTEVNFYGCYITEESLCNDFVVLNKNFYEIIKNYIINNKENIIKCYKYKKALIEKLCTVSYENVYKEHLLKSIIL